MDDSRAAMGTGEGWPLRPLLLAGLGLAAGIVAHLILGESLESEITAVQAASLMAVLLGAAVLGFTIERRMWPAAIGFSAAAAVVGGLVTWWNGAPGGWSASEGWRTVSLLLAVAIAAPLFQAGRDEREWRVWRARYPAVHDHAWTNAVLWCACWAFVGVVMILAWLLSALFELIKIDLLRELLEQNWFFRGLIGLAFGTALGVLREQDAVVRLLQRVVATVLAVLAPVLAAGLLLFVLALPFTGLQALWDATNAATPILLCCVLGALVLGNAVIGNAPAEERRFPTLRYGAMGLAAVMLPLAVLAAIATGLRIGQYGYTPERLWAVVFVAFACLFGIAYLASLVLGRGEWAGRARPANLMLALAICGVALILATPLVSFNVISTRDQVARLESGKVSAEKFDWRALAFDFGKPGRDALAGLRSSANAKVRAEAEKAAKAENRWDIADAGYAAERREKVVANTRVLPQGTPLPPALGDAMAQNFDCASGKACTVLLTGPAEALVLSGCIAPPPPPERRARVKGLPPAGLCSIEHYARAGEAWEITAGRKPGDAERAAIASGYAAGQIEVRTVPRRQLFVGGVAVGEPFE